MNKQIPVRQAASRKGKDEITNVKWIIGKKELNKELFLYHIDNIKTFRCVGHKSLLKTWKENASAHLVHLMQRLQDNQKPTVRTKFSEWRNNL